MPKTSQTFPGVRLLLSRQRCGSYFLKSWIEARFPTVVCSGELLEEPLYFEGQRAALTGHPDFPHFWLWYGRGAAGRSISVAPDRRMEAFEIYLSKLSALARPKEVVVDVKYRSLRALSGYGDFDDDSDEFTSFVTSRQIPVLHLIRKNDLHGLISRKWAAEVRGWTAAKGSASGEVARKKIRLNSSDVLTDLQNAQRLTQDYQTRFAGYPGYEELFYEDLAREQKNFGCGVSLRTLSHFLGRRPGTTADGPLPWVSSLPEDLSTLVENWDEVRRALRGTEFGWTVETPLLVAA